MKALNMGIEFNRKIEEHEKQKWDLETWKRNCINFMGFHVMDFWPINKYNNRKVLFSYQSIIIIII